MSDRFIYPALFVSPSNLAETYILIVTALVLLIVKIYAFVTALLYSAESYEAAGKQSKTTWCAILGVAVLLHVVPIPITIINLALLIAALVFLADVRPAIAGLRRR